MGKYFLSYLSTFRYLYCRYLRAHRYVTTHTIKQPGQRQQQQRSGGSRSTIFDDAHKAVSIATRPSLSSVITVSQFGLCIGTALLCSVAVIVMPLAVGGGHRGCCSRWVRGSVAARLFF